MKFQIVKIMQKPKWTYENFVEANPEKNSPGLTIYMPRAHTSIFKATHISRSLSYSAHVL
ncbi:hypothetical protein EV147_2831 [Cupriavidus agavae]|uniref:Uncharacterized protein n=1 Tax=Cupriavidus agavae TaxID=1001822 RepID=A0A4Q7RWR7_9BURK|nr:hypothetical protein EV147_2831 [Cupriavidus agavae]